MRQKTKILIVASAVIAVVAMLILTTRQKMAGPRTTQVERTSVVQDVSFTARLQSKEEADLGFAASGPITELEVAEGDVVSEGAPLAKIDARVASLDAAKARSDRATGQTQAEIAWEKAQLDRDNTRTENEQKIEEQKQVVRDKKAELDQALSAYRTRADDEGDDSYLAKTAYSTYLLALTTYNAAQEDLATLKKTVATANDAADKAAALAQEQYLSTTQASGSVAGLSSLQALESRAAVLLSQHTITAPFAGMITNINITKGEYAVAGNTIMRLETVDQLEVSGDVIESDAVKLAVGMDSTVTFDALPSNETWDANVTYVAPSARIVEGVPVYEVRLTINQTDKTLKPGLTADVTVHADSRNDVLAIPRRAITETSSGSSVQVINADGSQTEHMVTTGLAGSDGLVEITSGLSTGQTIVLSTRDEQSQ